MKTQTTIKTKVDKDSVAIDTALTIDWEGMAEEDMRALAQQALIVKLQSGLRRGEGDIPETLEVRATDYKVGVRQAASPKKVDVTKLSDAEKRALIEKLQASLA